MLQFTLGTNVVQRHPSWSAKHDKIYLVIAIHNANNLQN